MLPWRVLTARGNDEDHGESYRVLGDQVVDVSLVQGRSREGFIVGRGAW